MLKLFNNLKPFIENCYLQLGVREYARLQKISPPTASSLLEEYHREGLLNKTIERRYNFYRANRENRLFIDISKLYWRIILEKSGLLNYLNKTSNYPAIALFGSLSKAETKRDSDIDLAIFSDTDKEFSFGEYEKKIKRKIQAFRFASLKDVKNEDLRINIINGYILSGVLR